MNRTLVFGGARSGNSLFAERLARGSGKEVVYLATLRPGDEEMAARAARWSLVPVGAVSPTFADEAGRLKQELAACCDRVLFAAAGLPLALKGNPC